jgi:riboflavin synthase
MFTGIVEELGTVEAATDHGDGRRLRIAATSVLADAGLGASIAVNGCCLTLVERSAPGAPGWWETDVSTETLSRTNIGGLRAGDAVNLERPVRVEDRLGGHIVLGHVDAVGSVVVAAPALVVRVPPDHMRYLVEKGSVAVDGVSLTAFHLTHDTFECAVIPHTAAVTTLGRAEPGTTVNIELDVIAKHVERLIEPHRP